MSNGFFCEGKGGVCRWLSINLESVVKREKWGWETYAVWITCGPAVFWAGLRFVGQTAIVGQSRAGVRGLSLDGRQPRLRQVRGRAANGGHRRDGVAASGTGLTRYIGGHATHATDISHASSSLLQVWPANPSGPTRGLAKRSRRRLLWLSFGALVGGTGTRPAAPEVPRTGPGGISPRQVRGGAVSSTGALGLAGRQPPHQAAPGPDNGLCGTELGAHDLRTPVRKAQAAPPLKTYRTTVIRGRRQSLRQERQNGEPSANYSSRSA
jgi:hypothetical protein